MRARTRDNVIYLAVGLLVVLALMSYILYFDLREQDVPDLPLAPIWVTISALIVFGYTLREYRKYARLARFWILFAVLLMLHVVGWALFTAAVERLPLLLMGVALWPETFLVYWTMEKVVRRRAKEVRRTS